MKFILFLLVSFIILSSSVFANPIIIGPKTESQMLQFDIYIFAAGLTMTLTLEFLIGFVFFYKNIRFSKILLFILLANMISFPIVQLIASSANPNLNFFIGYPFLGTLVRKIISIFSYTGIAILFSEIFAIFFEACLLFYFNKSSLSFKKSIAFSLIANVASYLIVGYAIEIFSIYLVNLPIW